MEAAVSMHDLSSDVLRKVIRLLPDKNVAHFAMTCTRARDLVAEASLWEHKMTELLQNNPAFQTISHLKAATVAAWFLHRPFLFLYKLLVALGTWPEGIWREQPSNDHKWRFKGKLFKVTCVPGGRFLMEIFSDQRHFPSFELHVGVLGDWPVLEVVPLDAQQPSGYWQTLDAPLSERDFSDGNTAQGPLSARAFAPGHPSRWRPYKPGRPDVELLQPGNIVLLFCCQVPPRPLPDALVPLPRPTGTLPSKTGPQPSTDAILGRLQGMYTTYYGPHGMEFLRVTYGQMEPPLSELLPHGNCFAGLKITGDPNVPAGKLSFCVSAENVKRGPYDGFEREEVTQGVFEDTYRDIVKFGPGGEFALVDIEERPVIARYYGLGQINASTQLWAPKWVEVQVIAYLDDDPMFSLLWADPGRSWRHIMDFRAMQLSHRPSLSRLT